MEQERTFCPCCGWDVKVDEDELCMHCGATATGPAVIELAKQMEELERLRKQVEVKKTFCPNDGFGVDIDDENCCLECGWLAVGEAVDELYEEREELELLRKEKKAKEFEAVLDEVGTIKVSELCRKTHIQTCHICEDFSCQDNQNKDKK